MVTFPRMIVIIVHTGMCNSQWAYNLSVKKKVLIQSEQFQTLLLKKGRILKDRIFKYSTWAHNLRKLDWRHLQQILWTILELYQCINMPPSIVFKLYSTRNPSFQESNYRTGIELSGQNSTSNLLQIAFLYLFCVSGFHKRLISRKVSAAKQLFYCYRVTYSEHSL